MARDKRSTQRLTPTQARAVRRRRRNRRRRALKIAAAGLVGAIAFAFLIALFLPGLPIDAIAGAFRDGGPGERVPSQGQTHIDLGEEHIGYNTVPATSGWHYTQPLAPARWGVHDQTLPDEVLIHNLEHGGIGVHYNCPDGCEELIEQLTTIVNRAVGEDLKVIMSPYPEMSTRISLTAWTFIDRFDQFDEGRISDFINGHESSSVAPEWLAR